MDAMDRLLAGARERFVLETPSNLAWESDMQVGGIRQMLSRLDRKRFASGFDHRCAVITALNQLALEAQREGTGGGGSGRDLGPLVDSE